MILQVLCAQTDTRRPVMHSSSTQSLGRAPEELDDRRVEVFEAQVRSRLSIDSRGKGR